MSIRINLEIGHEASIRTKRTPEGFTHDWEVFVRGCDGAELHYYVEKVVFYLHETFPKPRRVIKEPPYSVKESGYAGFNLPIEIYLRNKEEPKKVRFNYDLHLQPTGPGIMKVQKEKYVFSSPSEEFKLKLLKGGGTVVTLSNIQNNFEPSRCSSETKNELTNKPKLGGSDLTKKYKVKVDEPRIPNSFQDLFGPPITKTSKVSELKPKDIDKISGGKTEKEKDKNKDKSKYSPIKEKDKDKLRDSERKKDEKKSKDRSREREHSKEKSVKKEKSPKLRSPSPKRSPRRIPSPKRPPSPPPLKHKEKDEKRIDSNKDRDKKERPPDEKDEKKMKKEKRDKDKEHKENRHKEKPIEHKDHKKERKIVKDVIKENESSPSPQKIDRKDKFKDRDSPKDPVKEVEISPDKIDKTKVEEKQKHKHKKKDKERKEKSKDKVHKEKAKDKEKIAKFPEVSKDKNELFSSSRNVEKPKKLISTLFSEAENESSNSSFSSTEESLVESSEKINYKKESQAEPKKTKGDQERLMLKREKTKRDDEKVIEKKRKRKSDKNEDEPVEKLAKEVSPIKLECSDSDQSSNPSQPIKSEAKNQDKPEDYMQILRDLQHKIMTLEDNSELQKVVQLIAKTGRYEVSARTFDFDLCLLEKSTVKQLQEFFATSL